MTRRFLREKQRDSQQRGGIQVQRADTRIAAELQRVINQQKLLWPPRVLELAEAAKDDLLASGNRPPNQGEWGRCKLHLEQAIEAGADDSSTALVLRHLYEVLGV
jgi:hypothetical protein